MRSRWRSSGSRSRPRPAPRTAQEEALCQISHGADGKDSAEPSSHGGLVLLAALFGVALALSARGKKNRTTSRHLAATERRVQPKGRGSRPFLSSKPVSKARSRTSATQGSPKDEPVDAGSVAGWSILRCPLLSRKAPQDGIRNFRTDVPPFADTIFRVYRYELEAFSARIVATNFGILRLFFADKWHIIVAMMFVDSSVTRLDGKTYTATCCARRIARTARSTSNAGDLTHCKREEVEAIRLALKYKEDLGRILASAIEGGPELKQGPSVGAVWLLPSWRASWASSRRWAWTEGKLALGRSSPACLSRVAAGGGAAGGRPRRRRDARNDRLRRRRPLRQSRLVGGQPGRDRKPIARRERSGLDARRVLYDVTSTYLEAAQHLGRVGYNRIANRQASDRDRTSHRRRRTPLSIEVFPATCPTCNVLVATELRPPGSGPSG